MREREQKEIPKETKKKDTKGGDKGSEGTSEDEGPCWIPSGILARFANTVKYSRFDHSGVELKFTEPLDRCLPETLWQIFPFKGEEEFGRYYG